MDDIFFGIQLKVDLPDTVQGVREYVESLCDGDDISAAFWFQRNFSLFLQSKAPRLSVEQPEIAVQYDRLISQCQWVALPRLPDNVTVDLFEKHMVAAFDWKTLTWEEKIKQALIIESDYDARDKKKKAMREALLRNDEKFTEATLIIDGKTVQGSVQHWIRDYLRTVGAKGGTSVAFAEYMTSGANARKLSENDRVRLKRLLETFDRLGRSSTTVDGIEEVIPVDDPKNPGVIRNGVFEPMKPEVIKDIDAFRAIRNAALGIAEPIVQATGQAPIKLPSVITEDLQLNDSKAFIRALNEAVAGKDIRRVGELLLAARENAAIKSLERVQEVKKLVYYDLKTKQFQWK